jgi:hypothetical protein
LCTGYADPTASGPVSLIGWLAETGASSRPAELLASDGSVPIVKLPMMPLAVTRRQRLATLCVPALSV